MMKNGCLKNSITFAFLAFFLSMKMGGLHVLTHIDDNDHIIHCTICDHAIVHNLIPAVSPDIHQEFKIETVQFVVQQEIDHYEFYSCGTISISQLFSRPPPFIC